jgi:hypothetical protein
MNRTTVATVARFRLIAKQWQSSGWIAKQLASSGLIAKQLSSSGLIAKQMIDKQQS